MPALVLPPPRALCLSLRDLLLVRIEYGLAAARVLFEGHLRLRRLRTAPPLEGVRGAHGIGLLGLLSLGLVCCLSPAFAAEMYGLPLPSPNDAMTLAWVRVAGLRDAGLGLAALALFVTQRSAGSRVSSDNQTHERYVVRAPERVRRWIVRSSLGRPVYFCGPPVK